MLNTIPSTAAQFTDREARDSFRNFLCNTLIGPGTDLLADADPATEQLADLPLRRYYSGVLFPRPTPAETTGQTEGMDTQDEDGNDDEADELNQQVEDQDASKEAAEENEQEEEKEELTDNTNTTQEQRSWTQNAIDYPTANQFFPRQYGADVLRGYNRT